jgi:transcriptional regulator GlxA family with amidase domain
LLRNYRERMALFSQKQQETAENIELPQPVIAAVDAQWLREVEQMFATYLADSRLNVEFAAGKMNLSERQFHRRLKQLTGLTPNQYLQEIRLQLAKKMLVEGRFATVKEVVFAVGFQDLRYFSELFEKHFGIKPSEMKR